MKNTPGPWSLELSEGLGCFTITDESTGELICKRSVVDADTDKLTVAQHNETAHLLVAAPKMLEALKKYERWEANLILDDGSWHTETDQPFRTEELYLEFMACQEARNEAIKKAEGEE